MPTHTISALHKGLIRRYLIWAYKSTKESFDRLKRKATQLMADDRILMELSKLKPPSSGREAYDHEMVAFKDYIAAKRRQDVPEGKHAYLRQRLSAIENTITHFLGAKELGQIKRRYEEEFTRRIWEAKDH